MLQLYWKNATDKKVGHRHGATQRDLDAVAVAIGQAHQTVVGQCRRGELGYAALPGSTQYVSQVRALVEKYKPTTTDLVVLGIGGSALGSIALQDAMNPPTWNVLSDKVRRGPRLFVVDNADPALLADTLRCVSRRLKTTLVNVISKSGETTETVAGFMVVREMLRKRLGADFAEHIVVTTNTEKGTLRNIAIAEGYDMLPVPDDVGGRFSILSPVGLFSAAMCDIDVEALLAGAGAMKRRVEGDADDWKTNIACMLAAIAYLMFTKKGKCMQVMMPYSNRLGTLTDWYRQLWAESLGKKTDRQGNDVFAGSTPVKALGATDQHSQVQLYREGPNDKLVVFLEVVKHPRPLRVPDVFADVPGLAYLRTVKLGKLLLAEKKATEYALAVSKRPSVTITFNSITPQSIGEFIYLYEFVTSLMGELLNVNAYDQPAVELGKETTFALIGREGYKDMGKKIRRYTRVDKQYLA